MLYELRIYTLYPGKLQDFLQTFENKMTVRERYSKLGGYWYTEIGELNQVVGIWPYESLDHRAQVRKALAQDQEWQKVVATLISMIIKQENSILVPANFSPLQ